MMRRGYSRDHRPDCEQMVIALIVNSEGFPFSYETFDGNRADVSTVETILRMVERKYGKARRIWIFDRGIVSEENLAAIRKRGGQYLVGTPRRQMKRFEAELVRAYAGPGTCERIVAAGTSRAKAPTCCAPTCRRRPPRSYGRSICS